MGKLTQHDSIVWCKNKREMVDKRILSYLIRCLNDVLEMIIRVLNWDPKVKHSPNKKIYQIPDIAFFDSMKMASAFVEQKGVFVINVVIILLNYLGIWQLLLFFLEFSSLTQKCNLYWSLLAIVRFQIHWVISFIYYLCWEATPILVF